MAVAFLSPETSVRSFLKHSLPGSATALNNAHMSTSSPEGQNIRLLASTSMAMMTFAGIRNRRFRVSKEATPDALESASGESNNKYAYKMLKIAGIVTILPFLFCLGNFFYDPALSDFNLEYGPHLAHPALRTTSVIQAIMVFSAVLWREKYRSDPIDRLFAWLFVPEAATHILLHCLAIIMLLQILLLPTPSARALHCLGSCLSCATCRRKRSCHGSILCCTWSLRSPLLPALLTW